MGGMALLKEFSEFLGKHHDLFLTTVQRFVPVHSKTVMAKALRNRALESEMGSMLT